MNKHILAAALMFLLQCGVFARTDQAATEIPPGAPGNGAAARQEELMKLKEQSDSRYINPVGTFLVAFFPGMYVQGLGFWYVGDQKRFHRLLRAELVGMTLMFAASVYDEVNYDSHKGFVGSQSPGAILGDTGVAILMYCWLYDIFGSMHHCFENNEKINEEIKKKLITMPVISPQYAGIALYGRF